LQRDGRAQRVLSSFLWNVRGREIEALRVYVAAYARRPGLGRATSIRDRETLGETLQQSLPLVHRHHLSPIRVDDDDPSCDLGSHGSARLVLAGFYFVIASHDCFYCCVFLISQSCWKYAL